MFLARIQPSGYTESRRLTEKIPLPTEEVRIWSIDLRLGRAAMCTCWDLLCPEEARLALRRRFANDFREFVVTRTLLRKVLAQYVDCSPADLCFDSSSNCKRVLRGVPSLHFNLSHSRNHALLAVAHRRVGMDLEFIKTNCMQLAVVEQFLSTSEWSQLQRLPSNARSAAAAIEQSKGELRCRQWKLEGISLEQGGLAATEPSGVPNTVLEA